MCCKDRGQPACVVGIRMMLDQCEAATDMSVGTRLSTEPEEKVAPRRKKGQPCEPTLRCARAW